MNPVTILPPGRTGALALSRVRGMARAARLLPARVRYGRPRVLILRTLAAAALAEAAAHSGAGPAPVAGVLTGIATWHALTACADLAPPPDGIP
jgi:hypothetical protein